MPSDGSEVVEGRFAEATADAEGFEFGEGPQWAFEFGG